MQFKEKKAIYVQIADMITDNILSGKWKEDERIPSVRELAVSAEVNPNTAARTYNYLQEKGIIKNKRGIGYFVSPEGVKHARETRKDEFIKNELPRFFRMLDILGMDLKTVEKFYKMHLSEK